jgi:murein L,D-transpeptidase YafK
MSTEPTTFCLTRCCRSAAITLAIGLAGLWVAASVRGNAAPNRTHHEVGKIAGVSNPRVVVLKSKRRLYLLDGSTLVRTYSVALGPDPVGDKLLAGDGRTPEGTFRICTKKRHSEHHRFLGIDYPDTETALRGLADGLLTPGEAEAISAARAEGRCPSWLTAVGGGIGLHGQGQANPHPGSDWTAGCIALADRDIEELFDVLRIGDEVEILP